MKNHVNGVSVDLSNISQTWEDGMKFFLKLVYCWDCIFAHNVAFDKKWLEKGRLTNSIKNGYAV